MIMGLSLVDGFFFYNNAVIKWNFGSFVVRKGPECPQKSESQPDTLYVHDIQSFECFFFSLEEK